MTWVDLAVISLLGISALLAFLRGLVREVLGVGAWIGALLAGAWGMPLARGQVHQWVGDSPWVEPATFIVIFLVALILLMAIAHAVGHAVRRSPLGGLDRTLGLLFGLTRGAALVILAYIIGGLLVPVNQWPEPVQHARLIGPTYDGAVWAVSLLPAGFQPTVTPPPPGRRATAEALLHATPHGSALSRPGGGAVRE